MKKIAAITLVIIIGIVPTSNALADSVAKEMCVAKVKEAVQLINEKGLDAAIAEINKKDGGFAWKDSYVFVVDFQGRTVANALFPDHVGRNQMGLKNKDGRMIIQEFIEIARTKGEGWVEYMWPKPEEMQKPMDQRISSKKASYVLRVPGKDMFVVAGVHDESFVGRRSSPFSALWQ
jgi:cytochrome c